MWQRRGLITNLIMVKEHCAVTDPRRLMLLPSIGWVRRHVPGGVDNFDISFGLNHLVELVSLYQILLSDVVLSLHYLSELRFER